MEEKMTDVTIVGCGVAGMSCSLYLQRAGIKPLILGDLGLSSLANSPEVKNYPGIQSISGVDLLFNMQSQISSMGNVEFISENCENLSLFDNSIILTTESSRIISKHVVIASGRRPRLLGINGEEQLIGNGISTCAYCDGNLYEGKSIAIVGGGNSAVEEAIYLSKIVSHIDMIIRKDHLRSELPENDLNDLKNVSIMFNTEICEATKENDRMLVRLSSGVLKEYDGIFYAIGQIPNTDFLPEECKDKFGYAFDSLPIRRNIYGEKNISDKNENWLLSAGDVSNDVINKQAITAAASGASKAMFLIEKML